MLGISIHQKRLFHPKGSDGNSGARGHNHSAGFILRALISRAWICLWSLLRRYCLVAEPRQFVFSIRFMLRWALPWRASLKNSYSASVMSPWYSSKKESPRLRTRFFPDVRCFQWFQGSESFNPEGGFEIAAQTLHLSWCLPLVRKYWVAVFFGWSANIYPPTEEAGR